MVKRREDDSVWKELLEKYLKEFMDYFFSEASKQIDWHQGYTFLDKELQKIAPKSKDKRRYVDKLVQVYLKDGEESWVLLHIEVQGQREQGFSERVYIYQYRLFDRYKKRVASFVVFADEDVNWKPDEFNYQLLGTKQSYGYSTVKLLDYLDRWTEMERDKNPFSIVVMAHLKAQETKKDNQERYRWKKILIKMLYERDYQKEEIRELFKFIDWLILLPEYLAEQLDNEIEEFERSNNMPYVTHIERRGIKKGLAQGREEGRQEGLLEDAREALIDILEVRFGDIAIVREKINNLTKIEKLKQLRRKAIEITKLADIEELLN